MSYCYRALSVFLSLALFSPTANAKTKLAVVTTLNNQTVSDVLALVDVELSEQDNISLLERREIATALKEQEVALSGLVDAANAIQVGKALSVELLAVVEGDDTAEKQDVLGLVVFDARLGVRLWDQTLRDMSDAEKTVEAIVNGVKSATEKHLQRGGKLRTVSVLGVRNVDLPRQRNGFCQSVGRLLERRLIGSPNVAVLERSFLQQVRQERALTDKAPRNALLGSLQSMQIEVGRGKSGGLQASVIVTDAAGKQQRVKAEVAEDSAFDLSNQLSLNLLAHLNAAPVIGKPNPEFDAKRLIAEAHFRFYNKQIPLAGELTEAALALAPDNPAVMAAAPRYLLWQAYYALDPAKAGPDLEFTLPNTSDERKQRMLVPLLRALDLMVRIREYEQRHEGIILDLTKYRSGHNAEFTLPGVFETLMRGPALRTAEGRRLLATCQARYRRLAFELVIPRYKERLLENPTEYETWGPYCWLNSQAPLYSSTSAEWTEVMLQHLDDVLKLLERNGPAIIRDSHQVGYSYQYFFNLVTNAQRTNQWLVDGQDFDRLRKRFEEMTKHSRPGVQLFGKTGILWADIGTEKLTSKDALARCEGIIEEAKEKIIEPGCKPEEADAERLAIYDVILMAIDILPPQTGANYDRLLALGRFMTSRNEISLTVVRRLVRVLYKSHAQYLSSEGRQSAFEVDWPVLWRGKLNIDAFADTLETIDRFTEIMNKGQLLDGNRFELEAELEHRRRRLFAVHPALGVGKGGVRPWTNADRPLSYKSDAMQWTYFSKPVLDGDHIYLVALSERDGGYLQLLRISLTKPSIALLGKTAEPPLQPGIKLDWQSPALNRTHNHVVAPQVSNGSFYCSTPTYGGLMVFPLDGSQPQHLTMKNTPGMPTNVLSDMAVADGKIFATTGEGLGRESFVHWYDPDDGDWQVIASSRRATAQTPLDYRATYQTGAVFDRPRHRILFTVDTLALPEGFQSGLYEFDVRTKEIRIVFDFNRVKPGCIQRTGPETLLFTFAEPGRGVFNAKELNLANEKWRMVYSSNTDSQAESSVISNEVFQCQWNLSPPYAVVGNQFWSFLPFGYVARGNTELRRFPVIEWRNLFYDPWHRSYSDHFEYSAKHRTVVYGTQYSLWLFLMPERVEGLLAHWKLDEARGVVVADLTEHVHNGRLVNGPQWVEGRVRSALHFDGNDDHVTLGNPEKLNFSGPITVAAWIKHEATDGHRNIVAHGMTNSPKAKLFLWIRDGHYEGGSWDGAMHKVSSKIPAGDEGKWVHLAVTYNGRKWRLYRNGEEVAVHEDAVGAIKVDENWSIGSSGSAPVRCFKGAVDEVIIFNAALSAESIKSLAAFGTAVK